jgi:L-cysteine/cystine lyase
VDLTGIRAELPALARLAYLNAGSMGPLPRRTAEAIRSATERELLDGRAGRAFWDDVNELRGRARAELALILGAPPETIALTTSSTESCNVVLTGLGIGPGDEVVTTDSEHPGLFGGLVASGARIRSAALREGPPGEALAPLEAEISPRTSLIAISHVSYLTGAVLPVRELAGRGIPLLVDGAQGAGAIPVDVNELGCDFYTVSAQKWLLGPDSTGCLYVHPDRIQELRMTIPSYMSWTFPDYEPKPDASRFDPGWIGAGALAGLLQSLAFAAEIGPERFALARASADRCLVLLRESGADVVTTAGQGTLVSFRAEEPEALVARAAEAGVLVRDLPGTSLVRASCGFWTSEGDLQRLAKLL